MSENIDMIEMGELNKMRWMKQKYIREDGRE
jgi:hypothetical protein